LRQIIVNSPTPDHVIVNAVLDGDTHQYNELVLRHKDYAYSLALKIVHNTMDAEEVAHDAFLKAYKSLAKFNKKAKFTTWLYRIVFNTAISHTRKNRIMVDDIDDINIQPTSGMNTSELLFSQDREKYIAAALEQLSSLDATLITLFYMKQLNLEEIGEVVGLKPSAIKVKLFRARKRLANELENLLQGEIQEML
jgi:RNA polymerase sigma factor (sigma-70 family)